jgi:hypothetical protein
MQSRAFYKELHSTLDQLVKMENHLSTSRPVGMMPETLRAQQAQFMVSNHSAFVPFQCSIPSCSLQKLGYRQMVDFIISNSCIGFFVVGSNR